MTEQENLTIEVRVCGDMYGDKVLITESHEDRAKKVFAKIKDTAPEKYVIAVGGPSGSGKSEIGALLGSLFIEEKGKKAYVLSCDNYPHRPPRENDAERLRLHETEGEEALKNYLGTEKETDLTRLGNIIASFKRGDSSIPLRIMNAKDSAIHEDPLPKDFSSIDVLVLEGTWSNLVEGVDTRVFLETDFEKTLAHRKKRARDPITPFGEVVLRIEQAKLEIIKENADMVVGLDSSIRKGSNKS